MILGKNSVIPNVYGFLTIQKAKQETQKIFSEELEKRETLFYKNKKEYEELIKKDFKQKKQEYRALGRQEGIYEVLKKTRKYTVETFPDNKDKGLIYFMKNYDEISQYLQREPKENSERNIFGAPTEFIEKPRYFNQNYQNTKGVKMSGKYPDKTYIGNIFNEIKDPKMKLELRNTSEDLKEKNEIFPFTIELNKNDLPDPMIYDKAMVKEYMKKFKTKEKGKKDYTLALVEENK
jgi:hypothetical protein